MTDNLVSEAAAMIREFDAGLANVFLNQPFRREAVADIFFAGFAQHTGYSLAVSAMVRNVAILDKMDRAGAAKLQK